MPKLAATRLTVEAALTGDRRLLVDALLADGAVTDLGAAPPMGDQLLEAHREPNFLESRPHACRSVYCDDSTRRS